MIYDPLPAFKRCSACCNEFPASPRHFYRNRTKWDGYNKTCRACASLYGTRYRALHKETLASSKKIYYSQHRRAELSRSKRWYRDNRALCITRAKALYHHTPHAKREYVARWQRTHPEYVKRNGRNKAQKRRARRRAVINTFTPTDWARCLEYWKDSCAVCGRQQGLWHTIAQDHWIPLSKGGGYEATNIIPLCHGIEGCNNSKNNIMPNEWLVDRLGAHKARIVILKIRQYFAWVKSTKC